MNDVDDTMASPRAVGRHGDASSLLRPASRPKFNTPMPSTTSMSRDPADDDTDHVPASNLSNSG